MKKKAFSILMILFMMFSILPFGSVKADAFSTGAKTLMKTKTVTIKPGKTYKSPSFKLNKKLCLQVPMEIWISSKDKKKAKTIKKGGIKISLYDSRGRKFYSYKESLKDTGRKDDSYETWGYFYRNPVTKPGLAKGRYYLTIKNTTNRIIKFKYKVKGYKKFATKADLKEEITVGEDGYANVGRIGPGLPWFFDIEFDYNDIDIDWDVEEDGRLYIYPISGTGETTMYIEMLGGREYEVDIVVEEGY